MLKKLIVFCLIGVAPVCFASEQNASEISENLEAFKSKCVVMSFDEFSNLFNSLTAEARTNNNFSEADKTEAFEFVVKLNKVNQQLKTPSKTTTVKDVINTPVGANNTNVIENLINKGLGLNANGNNHQQTPTPPILKFESPVKDTGNTSNIAEEPTLVAEEKDNPETGDNKKQEIKTDAPVAKPGFFNKRSLIYGGISLILAIPGVYFLYKYFKNKDKQEEAPVTVPAPKPTPTQIQNQVQPATPAEKKNSAYYELMQSLRQTNTQAAKEALVLLENYSKDVPNKRVQLLSKQFCDRLNKEQLSLVEKVYYDWL